MQSKTERITDALDKQGIMETSEVAEHTGLKTEVCERVLEKMLDSGLVYAVGDQEWQLNQ